MPKRIPISVAKKVAEEIDCRQVIVLAWDGKLTHVITYGKTVEDCDQAAQGGNKIKKILGWPEDLQAEEPSRVKRLKNEIETLKEELSNYKFSEMVAKRLEN